MTRALSIPWRILASNTAMLTVYHPPLNSLADTCVLGFSHEHRLPLSIPWRILATPRRGPTDPWRPLHSQFLGGYLASPYTAASALDLLSQFLGGYLQNTCFEAE